MNVRKPSQKETHYETEMVKLILNL